MSRDLVTAKIAIFFADISAIRETRAAKRAEEDHDRVLLDPKQYTPVIVLKWPFDISGKSAKPG